MGADKEPNWDAIWEYIASSTYDPREIPWGNWEEWQAKWFEEGYREVGFFSGRNSGRTQARHWLQQFDLANAINQGDIAGYIQRWHPQPAPSIPVSFRVISEDEAKNINFGVIYDEAEPFEGTFLARARGSDDHPPTMGGEDGFMGYSYQASEAATPPVLARVLRHCLLALGRILSVLDQARRH